MLTSPIIGRRAVHTRIEREWDKQREQHVEKSRQSFHGTIVALVVVGQYHHAAVVMLYDDGTLVEHELNTVKVEGETGGPYR